MAHQMSITLSRLFGDTIYELPEYQRPYAWTKKQLDDLWEDFKDNGFLQVSPEGGLPSNHYMGTVVVKQKGEKLESGESYVVYELIDGQQRLLTLVILVKAICDRLQNTGDTQGDTSRAKNLYNRYISRDGDATLRKLVLRGDDDIYLWDVVLGPNPLVKQPTTPAQRRMRNAYEFFRVKLGEIDVESVRALSDNIASRLLFLRYEVQSELEAGLVFEAINDRGKQLTQMDKIKSYFVYFGSKLNDKNFVDSVNQRWGKVMENIALAHEDKDDTEKEEDQLIRYHWIMRTGRPYDYEVHREVKKLYKLKEVTGTKLEEMREYINTLEEVSATYRQILKPLGPGFLDDWKRIDTDATEAIRASLQALHRIETLANFIPLLFAARKRLSNPADFREIARLCYLLGWRVYKVCNKRSDAGLPALSRLACDLYSNGAIELQRVLDELKRIISLHADDEAVQAELLRNSLSQQEQRYLLYEWERHQALVSRTAVIGCDEATTKCEIEHIFPLNPKYTWSTPQNEERYNKIIRLLGNLVLAEQTFNRSMGNGFIHEKLGLRPAAPVDPETSKKLIYPNSGLASQRCLADDQDLSIIAQLEMSNAPDTQILDAIEKFVQRRTDELVRFALEHWAV